MKKKMEEIARKAIPDPVEKKISRKAAIKKTGYIALSAATMLMLLSNKSNAATGSPAPPTPF